MAKCRKPSRAQRRARKAKLKNIRANAGVGTRARDDSRPHLPVVPDLDDLAIFDPSGEDAEAAVHEFGNIEITFEPLPEAAIEALPEDERSRIDHLSARMFEDPASLVPELRELVARYPSSSMLRNHLYGALNAAGEAAEAAAVLTELRRLFPAYIFGVVNEVMLLLAEGQSEQAREILETGPRGPLFHIAQFEPYRKLFHYTEVVAYQSMIGHYLAHTDRAHEASTHLRVCDELASDHPGTEALRRLLRVASLFGFFRRARIGRSAVGARTPRLPQT
jgi:hypothetical protein